MKGRIEVYNSVGGAAFFEGLVREWQLEGWQIAGVHAMREHEYRRPVGRIGHWERRWRMYGGFAWKCWRNARASRASEPLRVVTTNPFFAPSLVQWAARGRGATINLVYDLFPDALIHAGGISRDSLLARGCSLLTRRAFRECDASVFLGERLRRHAELAYGPARHAVVIPVGADGGLFRDRPPEPLGRNAAVTVLYAGQMGRMHDTVTLRSVICCASGIPPGVRLRFQASGSGYARLRAGVDPGTCEWGGPLSDNEWSQVMGAAHVALVTMSEGAQQVVMPSKTYSALVAGQAVLAVCPLDSDLADLIRTHDCGWLVAPGDIAGLRCALQEIASDHAKLLRFRKNAYSAGHRHYDVRILAEQWRCLFHSL